MVRYSVQVSLSDSIAEENRFDCWGVYDESFPMPSDGINGRDVIKVDWDFMVQYSHPLQNQFTILPSDKAQSERGVQQ